MWRQIKGDDYYFRIEEVKPGPRVTTAGFHASILRSNPELREVVRVQDTDVIGKATDRVIWGRPGFPTREAATNAVKAQGILMGLGPDIVELSERNDEQPAE